MRLKKKSTKKKKKKLKLTELTHNRRYKSVITSEKVNKKTNYEAHF